MILGSVIASEEDRRIRWTSFYLILGLVAASKPFVLFLPIPRAYYLLPSISALVFSGFSNVFSVLTNPTSLQSISALIKGTEPAKISFAWRMESVMKAFQRLSKLSSEPTLQMFSDILFSLEISSQNFGFLYSLANHLGCFAKLIKK